MEPTEVSGPVLKRYAIRLRIGWVEYEETIEATTHVAAESPFHAIQVLRDPAFSLLIEDGGGGYWILRGDAWQNAIVHVRWVAEVCE